MVEGVIPGGGSLLLEFVRSWIRREADGPYLVTFSCCLYHWDSRGCDFCAIANVSEGSRIDPRKFWS